jgi:hypothetical protein
MSLSDDDLTERALELIQKATATAKAPLIDHSS